MGYRIASFNLKKFGDSARIEGRRSLDIIYEIIKKEKFDVVAFQEIFSMGTHIYVLHIFAVLKPTKRIE